MRSAYSTNIKERCDHSTAIVDAAGKLIIQAEASLPIHIASMTGLMTALLEKFSDDIAPGDVFIANDPHVAGGTHLPDINLAMPVFANDALLGFVCNIAHHADVGGMVPGSMAGGMSEIFQEGLRVPVVRLFRRGELQEDLLELILLNVRVPDERRGDYYAQIAAARLGERRLLEIVDAYGRTTLEAAFGSIVERTATRMQSAIETIPDGVYTFEDVMDDDGLGTTDIPIRLRIEVTGQHIRFDFSGTADQVPGQYKRHHERDPGGGLLHPQGAPGYRSAQQSGDARYPGDHRSQGVAAERGISRAGGGARQHLPADRRRHRRRPCRRTAGSRRRCRQRRQYHGGVLGHRSALRRILCLSRNAGRRQRRARRP